MRLTTLERTVVDSIADIDKIAGLEEILRCILLIPSLSPNELLSVLDKYQNGFLYQKCGLILETINDSFMLPNSFFEECQKRIPNAKRYLLKEGYEQRYYKKWKLYAPADIQSYLQNG